MRTIAFIAGMLSFMVFSEVALARDVYVQGYTRADGTYVAPYVRTSPDSTINNNWSTSPNVNPYTGRLGTVAPNPYQSQYPTPAPLYSPYTTP